MKGKLSLSLGICLLAALAGPARAVPIAIQFDFSQSTVSMLNGLVQIPPDGSITSASGTLVVYGPGLATPTAGPATLQSFQLAANVNASTFGNTITGNPTITQIGAAGGGLTPSLAQAVFGPMQIALGGSLGCTGPSCAILSLPAVLGGTQMLSIAALPIANLAGIGNAFIDATFAITFNGLTGSLHLVGNEVSRVVIPEPHTASLLALGIFALAGWRIARTRR
jgi:hypothetical protein